jgi:hypothetical protein
MAGASAIPVYTAFSVYVEISDFFAYGLWNAFLSFDISCIIHARTHAAAQHIIVGIPTLLYD